LQRIAEWLAAGGGSGWLPRAPGTWGSLAALLPGWWLWHQGGVVLLLLAVILITVLGCCVCAVVLPTMAEQDPGWIVIDEWAGQWLTMAVLALFYSLLWQWVVLCFVAFRLYDIIKPWPVRPLEHVGSPWWSIMADDLAAGLLAGGSVVAVAGFFQLVS